jgi:hypothetical protein
MVTPAGWAEQANGKTKSKDTKNSAGTTSGLGEGKRTGDSGRSRL